MTVYPPNEDHSRRALTEPELERSAALRMQAIIAAGPPSIEGCTCGNSGVCTRCCLAAAEAGTL